MLRFKNFKKENPKAKCIVLCRTAHPYELDGVSFLNFKDGIEEALNLARKLN